MIFKKFFNSCFFTLFAPLCMAQNCIGPRLTAMGNNLAAVQDVWNINGNSAGITSLKSSTFAVSYSKYFYDTELSRQAAVFVLPFYRGAWGLGFQRYGISVYNEIKASTGIAKSFDNQLFIGLNANYHQIKITNYGTAGKFSFDVGFQYAFTNEIRVAIFFENPAQLNYNAHLNFPVQSSYQIGLAYQTGYKLLVAAGAKKEFKNPADVSLGLEYQLLEAFCLRGGMSLKPYKQFAGLGVKVKKMAIDAAFENQQNIGYIPQIALAYAF